MSETLYKDYLPANSRVIVDYTKEDKVSFSYPNNYTYDQAVKKFVYPTITTWWMAVNILLLFYAVISGFVIWLIILFLDILINSPEPLYFVTHTPTPFNPVLQVVVGILILIYLFYIPHLICWYLKRDKERLSEKFPKFGYQGSYLIGGTKVKDFTPEDIEDNKAIVPFFKNVFLEYNATEDFMKYLEKIEILEIPFSVKKIKGIFPFRKRTEKTYNEKYFSSVFYFSKKPLSGELKTEFI